MEDLIQSPGCEVLECGCKDESEDEYHPPVIPEWLEEHYHYDCTESINGKPWSVEKTSVDQAPRRNRAIYDLAEISDYRIEKKIDYDEVEIQGICLRNKKRPGSTWSWMEDIRIELMTSCL